MHIVNILSGFVDIFSCFHIYHIATGINFAGEFRTGNIKG